jgi:hypothetical protein
MVRSSALEQAVRQLENWIECRKIGVIEMTGFRRSAAARNEFDFYADVSSGGDFCGATVFSPC